MIEDGAQHPTVLPDVFRRFGFCCGILGVGFRRWGFNCNPENPIWVVL